MAKAARNGKDVATDGNMGGENGTDGNMGGKPSPSRPHPLSGKGQPGRTGNDENEHGGNGGDTEGGDGTCVLVASVPSAGSGRKR